MKRMFFKGVKNFEASIEIPSRKGDINRCFLLGKDLCIFTV